MTSLPLGTGAGEFVCKWDTAPQALGSWPEQPPQDMLQFLG